MFETSCFHTVADISSSVANANSQLQISPLEALSLSRECTLQSE